MPLISKDEQIDTLKRALWQAAEMLMKPAMDVSVGFDWENVQIDAYNCFLFKVRNPDPSNYTEWMKEFEEILMKERIGVCRDCGCGVKKVGVKCQCPKEKVLI